MLFTVAALMASLNVSTMALLVVTPVAPFPGLTAATVGLLLFATPVAPVVNVLVNGVTGFPAWSVNPPTVTIYVVLVASRFVGTNVSVVRSLLKLMAPLTSVPPAETVIALLPTLTALTGVLITTTTCGFTGTPLAPFPGLTCTTLGAVVTAPRPVVKLTKKIGGSECPCKSVTPLPMTSIK